MIERAILSIALILLFALLYVAIRHWHLRRASGALLSTASEGDKLTLLYFRSDSCAPCVTQNYYLQDLKNQYENRIAIRKIDADVEREVADQYGIFTLPTTLFVDPGGEVKYINYGLTRTNRLAQQLENLV
jgi:thiol-disulfide isomerase/thioredoxin